MILFFDASAVVYWVEGADPWFARIQDALQEIHDKHGPAPIAVSTLSWLECRVSPLRNRDEELLRRYDQFFDQPELVTVSLTVDVIRAATNLRARHNLKTPDALQAACALALGDTVTFVTGDHAFQRVPRLKVLRL